MYQAGFLNWTPRIRRKGSLEVRIHLLLPVLAAIFVGESFWYQDWLGQLGKTLLILVYICAVLLLHQLGHLLAAGFMRIPIGGILFWPFGGEPLSSSHLPRAGSEFWFCAGGFLAHLLLLIGGATFLPDWDRIASLEVLNPAAATDALSGAWMLAGYILILNLLPLFPLDSGRMFRAILSRWSGEVLATRIAVRVSQVLCLGLLLESFYLRSLLLFPAAIFILIVSERELRSVVYRGVAYDPVGTMWFAEEPDVVVDSAGDGEHYHPEQSGFYQGLQSRYDARQKLADQQKREDQQPGSRS
jgi:Zn-dependent protease